MKKPNQEQFDQIEDHAKWQSRVDTTDDMPSKVGLTPEDIAYNMWLESNAIVVEVDDSSKNEGGDVNDNLSDKHTQPKDRPDKVDKKIDVPVVKPELVSEVEQPAKGEELVDKGDKDKNRKKLGRMVVALEEKEEEVETRIDEALSEWNGDQQSEEPEPQVEQSPQASVFTDISENPMEDTSHSNTLTTTVTNTAHFVARKTRNTLRSVKSLAAKVFDQELVRNHDNDGQEIDPKYRENQEKVRALFVEKIESGEMYGESDDPHGYENFVEVLKQAHQIAASGEIYEKVGKGKLLNPDLYGVIRTKNLINKRYPEAQTASSVAEQYGDPYSKRFSNTGVMMTPNLYGISPEAQPRDIVGEGGAYVFDYPDHRYLEQYFKMANVLGQGISGLDASSPLLVDSIARQYQYLACARPFYQINNSIFMNLANAQLKKAGLEGVPHGELDTIAQRLQPDNFARYFEDYVMSKQPQK